MRNCPNSIPGHGLPGDHGDLVKGFPPMALDRMAPDGGYRSAHLSSDFGVRLKPDLMFPKTSGLYP